MTVDEAIAIVDQALNPERLNQAQDLVFRGCWAGKTYQEIADEAGYDSDYMRVIGSRLWQMLSEVFRERITKNNLQSVLRQAKPWFSSEVRDHMPEGQPLDFPGSPLAYNSRFYVPRSDCEAQILEEILRPGALIRLRAPNQWGKTSLMNRVIEMARRRQFHCVRINLQQAETQFFGNLERFLRWLCANITQQLQLESKLESHWDADLGSKVSCATYLQGYVLPHLEAPMLLVLDELQRVFEYPVLAQDFLPLLRVWHEESKNSVLWSGLRLLVVYSTESYIPLKINQSPFNVGLPVQLPPFNDQQARDLVLRYQLQELQLKRSGGLGLESLGLASTPPVKPSTPVPVPLPASTSALIAQLQALVNGHPYLLHLAIYHLSSTENISWQQLVQDATTQSGIYGAHLRHYLGLLQQDKLLGKAFKAVILSPQPIAVEVVSAYRLESMGLIKLQGDRAIVSCELYRRYFCDRLDQF